MAEPVIQVSNLSKSYFLGHQSTGKNYTAMRDIIAKNVQNLFRTTRDLVTGKLIVQGDEIEEFWALNDVSFEVNQGEVLGIIGRNGAGKSTLLKILSRITEPTKGKVEITGRVASLLEVGSGFHPELTGRENVFLNGAILGMSRAEIKRKFDEIVEFAEVEKFLDTPVKRYSSGMYMRLAFAVAAHLEPEILIVDEVLAVGDAAFQKKCLGKMQDVGKSGKTVLFVSHNMDAVLRLCSQAILLHKGSMFDSGSALEVVNRYSSSHVTQNKKINFKELSQGITVRDNLELVEAVWPESNNFTPWSIPFGANISFIVAVKCLKPVQGFEIGLALYSPSGSEIASTSSIASHHNVIMTPGSYEVKVEYQSFNLVPNNYTIGVGIKSEAGQEQHYPKAFSIDIIPSDLSSKNKTDTFWGYVVPEVDYQITKVT